jgi:hypothetical protein
MVRPFTLERTGPTQRSREQRVNDFISNIASLFQVAAVGFSKISVFDEPLAVAGRPRVSAARRLSKLFWKLTSQKGMPRTGWEKIGHPCG